MMKKFLMIAVLLGFAVTVSEPLLAVGNTFNINFWAPGGGDPSPWTEQEALDTIQLAADEAAGFGDWNTPDWINYQVPWHMSEPADPLALTSTQGATATFVMENARNGGPWIWDTVRTTLLDDANADMMGAHCNATEDLNDGNSAIVDMTFSDISLGMYDVIIYLGSQEAQFFDGTGTLVFNGGPEQDFTLTTGEFDGTFTEIVDSTTPGNYIVFKKLTEPSFTLQVWGSGFNHLGPTAIQFGVSDAMNPDPYDGKIVYLDENLPLSWTNLDAADGNDVYVDVWFGTEPNELNVANYDMTKIVVAGTNTESTTVDASVLDTYYWYVNSYLNGAAHINDANMTEGNLWSFIAVSDLPPAVEIVTLDQMTWSGEGVPIDATVDDDAKSALTIGWTADDDSLADANLTIDILNADQEDPTVMITKTVPTGDVVTVTMTLTATDGGNLTPGPEGTASIEIDVYDDACHMAKTGEGVSVDITDFNANCITDLEELAEMLAAWLDDYSATGPADRP